MWGPHNTVADVWQGVPPLTERSIDPSFPAADGSTVIAVNNISEGSLIVTQIESVQP